MGNAPLPVKSLPVEKRRGISGALRSNQGSRLKRADTRHDCVTVNHRAIIRTLQELKDLKPRVFMALEPSGSARGRGIVSDPNQVTGGIGSVGSDGVMTASLPQETVEIAGLRFRLRVAVLPHPNIMLECHWGNRGEWGS